MPISQHRMALASFIVAVIAVLLITGSSLPGASVSAHGPHLARAATAEAAFGPFEMGPMDPNHSANSGASSKELVTAAEAPVPDPTGTPEAETTPEPTVSAASATPGGPTPLKPRLPIAAVALSYVGTWAGECWTFMQDVVHEATGRTVGTDYIKGFARAGAYEVALDDARAGDIIQVVDDSYTKWDADYAGLHTSIVIENHNDGSYTVVSANADWDGMVTLDTKYRPEKATKMYPRVTPHVFRLPQPQGGPLAVIDQPVEIAAAGD